MKLYMKLFFLIGTTLHLYALCTHTQSHQMSHVINNTTITLCTAPRYDITCSSTEAIVNSANSMLAHDGGIARAISNAAGKGLQVWSYNQLWSNDQPLFSGERLAVGTAIVSPAFDLYKKSKIKYIVHTVGPDFRDPVQQKNGEKLLYDAWYNALLVANAQNISSVTFPSISTGTFQCPKEIAATQALRAIQDFLKKHPNSSIRTIVIGLWKDTWEEYKNVWNAYW